MIAILLATRGLVFSKVIEAIERERNSINEKTILYISTDKPIPDAQNFLVTEALKNQEVTSLLFVEEDTVPIAGALDKLLAMDSSIACIDYGVSGWGCVTRDIRNKILWCGLGCTLVKREVFEKLEYPYFRTDKTLRLNDWKWVDLPKDYQEKKQYGSLDIWFFTQAREQGFDIVQIDGECQHLQLDGLGEKGVNNGLHTISEKPKIEKRQIL